MKKATVQISFPAEKLEAIQHYMAEKGGNLDCEMEEALQKIYERIVPKEVRGFLEARKRAPANQSSRVQRSASSAAPQAGHSQEQV